MILERYNSVAVLGVYISSNMEINTLVPKMKEALVLKPELNETFGSLMDSLFVIQGLSNQITSKISTIIEIKSALKGLKRGLELAVKAYNVGSTISMKLMDVKPAVNGSPLATGADASLTPLKVAVENATTKLQDNEDLLDQSTTELIEMATEFEDKYSSAVELLMSKISELGNSNIII